MKALINFIFQKNIYIYIYMRQYLHIYYNFICFFFSLFLAIHSSNE